MRLFHLTKFKYPKLLLLIAFIVLSYFIFSDSNVQSFILSLGNLGYLGIFIAGMFFTFGFTTPFAIGFFVISNPDNIFLAALIGGLGALIFDLIIFKFVRFSLMDEFKRLEKTKPIKEVSFLIESNLSHKIRIYLLYAMAGVIIASPLPDELGILMLGGLTKIKISHLALISFLMNTIGVLILLLV